MDEQMQERETTMELKSSLVFALGGGQWSPFSFADHPVCSSGPDGALRQRVVNLIAGARETLCVCSFIIADEAVQQALLEAVGRGVRVYALTAADLKLKPGGDEDEDGDGEWTHEDRIREGHKQMLDSFTGRITLRSSGHYHAKYVIADGQRGLLTTCNLTTKAMMENPELGVVLDANTCADLMQTFQYQFWEQAGQELMRKDTLDAVQAAKRFDEPVPGNTSLLRCTYTTDKRSGLLDEVLALIDRAERTLWVTSYGWGHPDVMSALKAKAAAGVSVHVIGRNHRGPFHTNPMLDLAEGGCQVRGLRLIHAKSLLIDPGAAHAAGLVMSANVDQVSLGTSHDVGVRLEGEDVAALHTILEGWWNASHRLLTKDERATFTGEVSHFDDGWSRLLIVPDEVIDHGALEAPSAHKMTGVSPPKASLPGKQLRRRLTERWTVVAPRLPKGSKEERWRRAPSTRLTESGKEEVPGVPHDHPVFLTPDKERVVVVRSLDEAKAASTYLKTANAKRVVLG